MTVELPADQVAVVSVIIWVWMIIHVVQKLTALLPSCVLTCVCAEASQPIDCSGSPCTSLQGSHFTCQEKRSRLLDVTVYQSLTAVISDQFLVSSLLLSWHPGPEPALQGPYPGVPEPYLRVLSITPPFPGVTK